MANVKHIGKMTTGEKVIVLFKTVPNEDHNCLVTPTDKLPRLYHDRLMEIVESEEGQQSGDLADLLGRRFFADGNNMLQTLHINGYISKVNTKNVLLTPNHLTAVPLNEVNALISKKPSDKVDAELLAKPHYSTSTVTDDMSGDAVSVSVPVTESSTPVDVLLLQAEFHEKEAARLRKLASEHSTLTTNDALEQKKKRGRPPKIAAVG